MNFKDIKIGEMSEGMFGKHFFVEISYRWRNQCYVLGKTYCPL